MSPPSVPLEAIVEQRRLNWRDFHPETYCHRCGGLNVKSWHAPSPLWNEVMRVGGRETQEPFEGIVCPRCFAELAEQAGVVKGYDWCFTVHDPLVPLATTFDGRVWNPETCMWEMR